MTTRRRPTANFPLGESWIPLEPGQAVDAGWPEPPEAVTWHWTATATLDECDRLLGGADAERRGAASAHVAVGRSFREGVSRYVSWENRSWHAGKCQTLRWDGRRLTSPAEKGARTSIGVETVNIGYARPGVPADDDWIDVATVDGRRRLRVQPWTEEQVEMMIAVGREIVERWPRIGPRAHHGHHDLCPGYKVDVAGFPFARVLRGIYDDETIPDVWSDTWTPRGRRRALGRAGFKSATVVDDPSWTRHDDLALRHFQREHCQRKNCQREHCQRDQGLPPNGLWTTAVAWRVHDAGGG